MVYGDKYKSLSKLAHSCGNEKRVDIVLSNLELVKAALDGSKGPYLVAEDLNMALGDLKLIIAVADKVTR